MKKVIHLLGYGFFSLIILFGTFVYCNTVSKAETSYEDFAFFCDTYSEALMVAESYDAELLGYANGIGQIRIFETDSMALLGRGVNSVVGEFGTTSNVISGNSSAENETGSVSYNNSGFVRLYPDIIYSNEITTEYEEQNQWHLDAVRAREAFEISKGSGIIVAVIDSGIDTEHEDLNGAIYEAVTVIPDSAYEEGGFFKPEYKGVQDNAGHGTHVAGIIAARDNSMGTTGVAPESSILSIKASDLKGNQSQAKTSWVVSAVNYAMEKGVRVINISLGGSNVHDEMLEEVLNTAASRGIAIVCSAGNIYGTPVKMYPGAYDSTIAVSAVRKAGTDVMFASSYSNSGDYIDISAPGSSIYSTYPGGYRSLTGTSMASPIVAGAIADLLSVDNSLSLDMIKNILYKSATDKGNLGWDPQYGNGVVNLQKMLSPYGESEPINVPIADVRSGGIIAEGQRICLFSPDIGGRIVYTIDGTEPTIDSAVTDPKGILLEYCGEYEIKAAVLSIKGVLGNAVTFRYTVIPKIIEMCDDYKLHVQSFPDKAISDPVLGSPCVRYHATVGANKKLTVTLQSENDAFNAFLFDREGADGIAVGDFENGKLSYTNEKEYERDIWISVVKTKEDANSSYTLEIAQGEITKHPSDNNVENVGDNNKEAFESDKVSNDQNVSDSYEEKDIAETSEYERKPIITCTPQSEETGGIETGSMEMGQEPEGPIVQNQDENWLYGQNDDIQSNVKEEETLEKKEADVKASKETTDYGTESRCRKNYLAVLVAGLVVGTLSALLWGINIKYKERRQK